MFRLLAVEMIRCQTFSQFFLCVFFFLIWSESEVVKTNCGLFCFFSSSWWIRLGRATIWYNRGQFLRWRRVLVFIIVSISDCIFWSLPLQNCESETFPCTKDTAVPADVWLTPLCFFLSDLDDATKRFFLFCSCLHLKSWKQVSHFVSFQSDIYGLITWDHWINSAESRELFTASTPPDRVPRPLLRAFCFESFLEFCTFKINTVKCWTWTVEKFEEVCYGDVLL